MSFLCTIKEISIDDWVSWPVELKTTSIQSFESLKVTIDMQRGHSDRTRAIPSRLGPVATTWYVSNNNPSIAEWFWSLAMPPIPATDDQTPNLSERILL